MSSRYLIVADGQTDRQTKAISIPRYALVHRAVMTCIVVDALYSVVAAIRRYNFVTLSYLCQCAPLLTHGI